MNKFFAAKEFETTTSVEEQQLHSSTEQPIPDTPTTRTVTPAAHPTQASPSQALTRPIVPFSVLFKPPPQLDLTLSCKNEFNYLREAVARDNNMLFPMVVNNFQLAAMGISILVDVCLYLHIYTSTSVITLPC